MVSQLPTEIVTMQPYGLIAGQGTPGPLAVDNFPAWFDGKSLTPFARRPVALDDIDGIYEVVPRHALQLPYAVLYCRVSTGDQASVPVQVELGIGKAGELRVLIGKVIVDRVSASSLTDDERPGYEHIRELAGDKRISHVIVFSNDRLTRKGDLDEAVTYLETHGARVIWTSPTEQTPTDDSLGARLTRTVNGYVASQVPKFIQTGVRLAYERMYVQGLLTTRPGKVLKQPPFGYTHQNGRYVADGVQSERIRIAVEEILKGATLSQAVDVLNKLETAAGNSTIWTCSLLKRRLQNPMIAGFRRRFRFLDTQFAPMMAVVVMDPLIDLEAWRMLQRCLTGERVRRAPAVSNKESQELASGAAVHLLSGLVTCATCGRKLTLRPPTRRCPAHTFHCPGEKSGDCICSFPLPEPIADQIILNLIQQGFMTKPDHEILQSSQERVRDDIRALGLRVEELRQRDKAMEAKATGIAEDLVKALSPESRSTLAPLSEMAKRLEQERTELAAELQAAEDELKQDEIHRQGSLKDVRFLKDVGAGLNDQTADSRRKREVFKKLVTKCSVDLNHMSVTLQIRIAQPTLAPVELVATFDLSGAIQLPTDDTELESSPVLGPLPFGLRYRSGKHVVQDAEAEVVRFIFTNAVENTNKDLTQMVNEAYLASGVLGPEPWTESSIARVLRNPRYCGFDEKGRAGRATNRKWCKEIPFLPAIVDPDTWDKAQPPESKHARARAASRARTKSRRSTRVDNHSRK